MESPAKSERSGRSPSPERGQSGRSSSKREGGISDEGQRSPSERGRSPSRKKGDSGGGDSRGSSRSRSGSPSKGRGGRSRSRSPGRFGEKDFEHKKVSLDSAKKRKDAIAKVRGLKLDPKEWSRAELLDKLKSFSQFKQDSKTGTGTIVVTEKRLLKEDVQVLLEIMRRITEIQYVTITGCSLTDEVFLQLCPGLAGLRHLKLLDLKSNLLGTNTVNLIIKTFSKLSRKLATLDLQFNSLNYNDGRLLYSAFYAFIKQLNGLAIQDILSTDAADTLALTNQGLRLAEVAMVCSLMVPLKRLHTLNLAGNRIDAEGLVHILDTLKEMKRIQYLDLSGNPLTNDGVDFTGIEALVCYAKRDTILERVHLEGISFPNARVEEQLQLSLAANRSVAGHANPSYFSQFTLKLIQEKAKVQDLDDLSSWQGKGIKELDLGFIKVNHVTAPTVEVVEAENSATGKDEIEIKATAAPSRNIIEF